MLRKSIEDKKKEEFNVWLDNDSKIILKVSYSKFGDWEYIVKKIEKFKKTKIFNNTWLIKFISTKKPKKKIQYMQVTAVFLLLLNATNSGSSIFEISCFPFTG